MRLKRSGRVMLASLFVLIFFTGAVAWHNGLPEKQVDTQDLLQTLSQHNPKILGFVGQVEKRNLKSGFYSLGLSGQPAWPTSVLKACYSDPLLAKLHSRRLGFSSTEKIELIRYRSLRDFLELLSQAEYRQPGILAKIDFRAHRPITETPLAISFQSLSALVLGFIGVLLVKSVPE